MGSHVTGRQEALRSEDDPLPNHTTHVPHRPGCDDRSYDNASSSVKLADKGHTAHDYILRNGSEYRRRVSPNTWWTKLQRPVTTYDADACLAMTSTLIPPKAGRIDDDLHRADVKAGDGIQTDPLCAFAFAFVAAFTTAFSIRMFTERGLR